MTCQEFHENIYEYLDLALDDITHRAVQEHLRACRNCRKEMERESEMAGFLNSTLHQQVVGISFDHRPLGLITRSRFLQVPSLTAQIGKWRELLWTRIGACATAAATVLVGLAVIAYQILWPGQGKPASRPPAIAGQTVSVINAPMVWEGHVFKRNSGTVIDALTGSPAVAHARLP